MLLIKLLSKQELKLTYQFGVVANTEVCDLTATDLSKLFIILDIRGIKNGRLPEGHTVCFAWVELVERAMEKKLNIF